MGHGVLDFRSENGQFTGSWGREEHSWQENPCYPLRNNGTLGIQLTGTCLKPSCLLLCLLLFLIQIRLRLHPKISCQKLVFLSESLGQKRGESQSFFLSLLFLNNQFKLSIPEGGSASLHDSRLLLSPPPPSPVSKVTCIQKTAQAESSALASGALSVSYHFHLFNV